MHIHSSESLVSAAGIVAKGLSLRACVRVWGTLRYLFCVHTAAAIVGVLLVLCCHHNKAVSLPPTQNKISSAVLTASCVFLAKARELPW